MLVDERMLTYIASLQQDMPEFLRELETQALAEEVPIIRRQTQSLLRVILAAQAPKQILEVGTAVGFSALFMNEYNPANGQITTIEKYEKRIPVAKENFKKAGKEQEITLIEGDAADILKDLKGPYDLIFMDAAKGQYIHFLPEVCRLLAEGGVLVSDNVLQDGDVVQSRFVVTRRNRTIHSRMREYLYALHHHPRLVTTLLPVGDGVAVSVKRER